MAVVIVVVVIAIIISYVLIATDCINENMYVIKCNNAEQIIYLKVENKNKKRRIQLRTMPKKFTQQWSTTSLQPLKYFLTLK